MIVGKVGQGAEQQLLPFPIQTGLRVLQERDWRALPVGRYEIQGEDIFVQLAEYDTEPWHVKRPESHIEYVDIQYVAAGRECIGWSVLSEGCQVDEDCRPGRDLIFYRKVQGETMLQMTEGMFAILFPEDVHRPGCKAEEVAKVRKAVVKIRVSLLK